MFVKAHLAPWKTQMARAARLAYPSLHEQRNAARRAERALHDPCGEIHAPCGLLKHQDELLDLRELAAVAVAFEDHVIEALRRGEQELPQLLRQGGVRAPVKRNPIPSGAIRLTVSLVKTSRPMGFGGSYQCATIGQGRLCQPASSTSRGGWARIRRCRCGDSASGTRAAQ